MSVRPSRHTAAPRRRSTGACMARVQDVIRALVLHCGIPPRVFTAAETATTTSMLSHHYGVERIQGGACPVSST
ncbi:hypothetical protein OH76DRAFT_1413452 [Lentinus brumalis]|uniref:Uncharacterized protein n=1 Tax=Lentinus brumalis TaxID=2498619 RepID=A0A371CH35_9APHY|nr:hypothetical protein OH76DRAFT_1413452 [Polyporus brumalis]